MPDRPDWTSEAVGGFVSLCGTVTIVGIGASWEVLSRKPLGIMRGE